MQLYWYHLERQTESEIIDLTVKQREFRNILFILL